MKKYICHCDVKANDGTGHITAKPTIYVDANDNVEAIKEAEQQLTGKYKELGCKYVSVRVSLLKEI